MANTLGVDSNFRSIGRFCLCPFQIIKAQTEAEAQAEPERVRK